MKETLPLPRVQPGCTVYEPCDAVAAVDVLRITLSLRRLPITHHSLSLFAPLGSPRAENRTKLHGVSTE
jgi:hypothetical protein